MLCSCAGLHHQGLLPDRITVNAPPRRPGKPLTAAAGRMRNGDTAARVRVSGRDEIARLGNAFNEMAEQRCRV
ncbi:HAMP domain-containing protein, partial [Micromonospora sp. Rc5]|uniref:HAMP domain-containing protein n=1 Tax=Micromonospora sp. Rc5 TaxID=1920666 RepID=UPI0026F426AD